MPRPKRRLTRAGGSRGTPGNGVKYRGAPPPPSTPDRHVSGPVKGRVTTTCPVCAMDVGVKMDGTIGSHRVGKSRKLSWPCAGSGRRPTGEVRLPD